MYTAYGDESADETKQRVFAIGGLFGNATDWNGLRKKWRSRTGGSIFHATECDADQGAYADTDHRLNKKLYADLVSIIADSNLIGFGVAVSLPDYYELLAPLFDDDPYYLCFQTVIVHLATKCARCLPQDRIKFTFDRNTQIEHNASALYDRMINSRVSSEFKTLVDDEVAFATRKTIGIQTADIIARETMKLLDNRYGPISRPTRRSTQVLQASHRITFRLYTRAWCERVIRDSREYQFPKKECYDWLERRRLNDTLANRLRYEMFRETTAKEEMQTETG